MPKVVAALGRFEARQTRADGDPQHLASTTARLPQDRFQLRKGVLNRIEIRTVFRQKPERRSDVFNRPADRGTLVTRQVIHDDDVARREGRDQDLLNVGEEARAIDRAIKHGRGGEACHPERREKRRGVPASIGRVVRHAGAVEPAAIPPDEVRSYATFIEKHEPRGVEVGRRGVPHGPRERDVSAIVFRRAYRFF